MATLDISLAKISHKFDIFSEKISIQSAESKVDIDKEYVDIDSSDLVDASEIEVSEEPDSGIYLTSSYYGGGKGKVTIGNVINDYVTITTKNKAFINKCFKLIGKEVRIDIN